MSRARQTKTARAGRRARPREPITDREGRIRCEVCKRFFHSLAAHVRVHGLNAESYRAAHGSVCFWSVPTRRRRARWHRHPTTGAALPFPQDGEELLEVLKHAPHRGGYPPTARYREMGGLRREWAGGLAGAAGC